MVEAILTLMTLGLLFGAGLAFASRVLAVKRDERIEAVEAALPGGNCGACGKAGCGMFAEALVEGRTQIFSCPVADPENLERIAEILDLDIDTDSDRKVAVVRCQGDDEVAKDRFRYIGIKDCNAAQMVAGGHKACEYGCLGQGTCVGDDVCPFDAIYMGPNGLPVIIEEKCTGCGNCVEACPRNIIALMPQGLPVYVLCVSHDGPKYARKACDKACIACGMCVRKCPNEAFVLEDKLAVVDYDKCQAAGVCIDVCPTGALVGPAGSEEKRKEA